jgi:hypothetical protein
MYLRPWFCSDGAICIETLKHTIEDKAVIFVKSMRLGQRFGRIIYDTIAKDAMEGMLKDPLNFETFRLFAS